MAIGLGLIVAHSYRRTFDAPSSPAAMPRIVPLAAIAF
jgi:hypothetical protein